MVFSLPSDLFNRLVSVMNNIHTVVCIDGDRLIAVADFGYVAFIGTNDTDTGTDASYCGEVFLRLGRIEEKASADTVVHISETELVYETNGALHRVKVELETDQDSYRSTFLNLPKPVSSERYDVPGCFSDIYRKTSSFCDKDKVRQKYSFDCVGIGEESVFATDGTVLISYKHSSNHTDSLSCLFAEHRRLWMEREQNARIKDGRDDKLILESYKTNRTHFLLRQGVPFDDSKMIMALAKSVDGNFYLRVVQRKMTLYVEIMDRSVLPCLCVDMYGDKVFCFGLTTKGKKWLLGALPKSGNVVAFCNYKGCLGMCCDSIEGHGGESVVLGVSDLPLSKELLECLNSECVVVLDSFRLRKVLKLSGKTDVFLCGPVVCFAVADSLEVYIMGCSKDQHSKTIPIFDECKVVSCKEASNVCEMSSVVRGCVDVSSENAHKLDFLFL